jgi:two-component system, chemotaxis family, protein-glutamate methylesterase/glutaminase
LLRALPEPLAAVMMVVLHRPSNRISYLREILAWSCGIPVVIAYEAERLVPGTCYIGEPDGHLTLVDKHFAHLVPGADDRLRNRTVDTLFNSLAEHAAERAIGVVLSGSSDDGSRGLAAIRAAGGFTMVLDPGRKPRGMQQNAIDYDGPIDFIGTAREIADRVGHAIASNAARG